MAPERCTLARLAKAYRWLELAYFIVAFIYVVMAIVLPPCLLLGCYALGASVLALALGVFGFVLRKPRAFVFLDVLACVLLALSGCAFFIRA